MKMVADLKEITDETLGNIIHNKKKPFSELKELIIAIQESNSREVILTEVETFSVIINENKIFIDEWVEEVFEEAKPVKKEIYIPQRVENLNINGLPLSDKLISFLIKNNVQLIGDLQKISVELLDKIIKSPIKPSPELRHYILAFQESDDNEIVLVDIKSENDRKDNAPEIENTNPSRIDRILSRTIFVPLLARKWAISNLPISLSLIDKLEKCGYIKLNDLNATTYARIAATKVLEQKDVLDLYLFLSQIQSEEVFSSVAESVVEAKAKAEQSIRISSIIPIKETHNLEALQRFEKEEDKKEIIQIPTSLRQLPIVDLAPSDELRLAFKKEKLLFVGQLDGISYFELREKLKLSKSNVEELQNLIAFAQKFSRYTIFKRRRGFENIKKAALRRKENETSNSSDSAKTEKSLPPQIKQSESGNIKYNQSQMKETGLPQTENSSTQKFIVPLFSHNNFVVPVHLRKIRVDEFGLTDKLNSLLNKLHIKVVGDLESITYKDVTKTPFFTREADVEFRQFLTKLENFESQTIAVYDNIVSIESTTFDLPDLMKFINEFSSKLPSLDREIFFNRFGGTNDERILTFEVIASNQQISRERAYQIYMRTLSKLKDKIRHHAADVFKKLYVDCLSAVCPLTSKFLVHLTNNEYELFQYAPSFYVRIFGISSKELPILPEIKNQNLNLEGEAGKVESKIKSILANSELPVSLPELFNRIMTDQLNGEKTERNFFEAVQSAKFNLIETDKPNELFLELR